MAGQMDNNARPRLDAAIDQIRQLVDGADSDAVRHVYTDLLDRARALNCWVTTQRNTCAWVGDVYGYRDAETDAQREAHAESLQRTIDLDVENTKQMLDLWETSDTEVILVSDVGETSFIYGDNIGDLLRRKLELVDQYRNHTPRIDPDIMWRLP